MKSIAATIAAIGGLTVVLACGSEGRRDSDGQRPDRVVDGCTQFKSCASCTPILGCGWCFDSDGNGQCASGPGECTTSEFTWTWNTDGCRVSADAASVQVAAEGDAGARSAIDASGVVQEAATCSASPADANAELDGAADAGACPSSPSALR